MNIIFGRRPVRLFTLAEIEAKEAAKPAPRFELRGITYEYCVGADRWIMAPGQVFKPGADELKYGYSPAEFEKAILEEMEDTLYGSAQPGCVAAEEDRCITECGAFLNKADYQAFKDDLEQAQPYAEQVLPEQPEDDGWRCTFSCGDVVTFKSGGAWMTIEDLDYHGEGVFTADLIWTEETGKLWELDGIDVRLLSLAARRNDIA